MLRLVLRMKFGMALVEGQGRPRPPWRVGREAMREEWRGRVGWRVISAMVESSILVKLVTISLSQLVQEKRIKKLYLIRLAQNSIKEKGKAGADPFP